MANIEAIDNSQLWATGTPFHMQGYILDESFETLDIVDEYQSFVWTERYYEAGEFQLDVRPNSHMAEFLKWPNYLQLTGSDILMCIQTVELQSNIEEGDILHIEGQDLLSILNTRKVYYKLAFKDEALLTAINKIFNDNILDSTKTERKYTTISRGTDELTRNKDRKYTGDLIGDGVGDAIGEVCQSADWGMKMLPDFTTSGKMKLILYDGVDRSDEQEALPPVVFTPSYENILNSKYFEDTTPLANAALVIGGEHSNLTLMSDGSTTDTDPADIYAYINRTTTARNRARVECTVDGSGESTTDKDGNRLSRMQYATNLVNAANTAMDKMKITKSFSGEVDPYRQFIYRRDFELGDICTIQDAYGHSGKVRVCEIMHSEDESGYFMTPTFMTLTELPDPSEISSTITVQNITT